MDGIRRVLEAVNYKVRYVQNFTDIDDKIIKRATEQNIPYHQLTQTFIDAYFEDMAQLNILPADRYPRATEYIPQMISVIERLIESGNAYIAESGDVWFEVHTFEGYGKLSKKKIDELEAGARVEVTEGKRDPNDFVLWKSAKPGEPFWESPWGPGRPGWHIECSAMAMQELGPTIDIHAGGEDLVFPHHENEICQSEAVTGKPFVRYWIHNGFVTIKNEKMSKSTGNFFTLRDILAQFSGPVLRFFLLRSHYRTPLQFSFEGVAEAKAALDKLVNTVHVHALSPAPTGDLSQEIDRLTDKFWAAVTDDFNFAEAIGILFEFNRVINTAEISSSPLQKLMSILGIEIQRETEVSQNVLNLLELRWNARQNRDFATADRLREELFDHHHIVVEDSKTEYRWKKLT
jgi:cysteinyl-tRNA synthetase